MQAQDGGDLPQGQVFARRYRVDSVLGRGGMGVVYRARDAMLNEDVALKVLSRSLSGAPDFAQRFRQEVKIARHVSHPNVVRVHDLGEAEGQLYLTMELVAGTTLRGLLRERGRLLPEQAMGLARAVAEGLGAAHAAGVVHRDLKPSNVLLDTAGRVVLSDFGIARWSEEDLGLTHGPIGTPAYMAPEQAAGGAVDARADVYAFGLLLHEVLCGARYSGVPGEAGPRLREALAQGGVELPGLVALVERCLLPGAGQRPSSGAELRRLLDGDLLRVPSEEPTALTVNRGIAPRHEGSGAAEGATGGGATGGTGRATGTQRGAPRIAVLPFRYRGPRDQDYLGDALADELVDALSSLRELRVLGSSVTERYRDARDPVRVGQETGAQALIDGAVQGTGTRVRVSVRLLSTATGEQHWSHQQEVELTDVFAVQAAIVRRVADELRIELTTMVQAPTAPADVIERYLEARRDLRAADFTTSVDIAERLSGRGDRAFGPSAAVRALAAVRAWALQNAPSGHDWAKESAESVALAVDLAPQLAETQLASALLALQQGRYPDVAVSLARSLQIAPTYAQAHEVLGLLQGEAGRLDASLVHLRLASELDPLRSGPWHYLATRHLMLGEHAEFEAALGRLSSLERSDRFHPSLVLSLRHEAWYGGRARAEAALSESDRLGRFSLGPMVESYARATLGEPQTPEAITEAFNQGRRLMSSLRLQSLSLQIEAEAQALAGHRDAALRCIHQAASTILLDLVWLTRCPMFDPVRSSREMQHAVLLVRQRADAIWPT